MYGQVDVHRVPQHVVSRSFAHETVLLNVRTGLYHSLDPVAGRMFDLLAAGRDVDAVQSLICAEYDAPADQVRNDVLRLCADLLDRGLLEPGTVESS